MAPSDGSPASAIASTSIGFSENEDQPVVLEKDALGFKPYVEAVYSFLQNPATRPPFTMSIEDEWGTGKSSFMLQYHAPT